MQVLIYETSPFYTLRYRKVFQEVAKTVQLNFSVRYFSDVASFKACIKPPVSPRVYLLDTGCYDDPHSGIELVRFIRLIDPNSAIAFVSETTNMSEIIFKNHLSIIDYIDKNGTVELTSRIGQIITLAYRQSQLEFPPLEHIWQIQVDKEMKMIPYKKIMFIETTVTPHRLVAHLDEGTIEFRGAIKEIAKNHNFFRCHKSAVVNLENIDSINTKKDHILMTNGSVCKISIKGLKDLKTLAENNIIAL